VLTKLNSFQFGLVCIPGEALLSLSNKALKGFGMLP
jgi:hypothetical protein